MARRSVNIPDGVMARIKDIRRERPHYTENAIIVDLLLEGLDALSESMARASRNRVVWCPTVTYAKGHYCTAFNRRLYESLQDSNRGHDPMISPTWWSPNK